MGSQHNNLRISPPKHMLLVPIRSASATYISMAYQYFLVALSGDMFAPFAQSGLSEQLRGKTIIPSTFTTTEQDVSWNHQYLLNYLENIIHSFLYLQ